MRTREVGVGVIAFADELDRKYTSNISPSSIVIATRVPVNVNVGSIKNP